MPDPVPCPEAQVLQAFLRGEVAGAEAESLERHLRQCARCTERVRLVRNEVTLQTGVRQGPGDAGGAECTVERPPSPAEAPTVGAGVPEETTAQPQNDAEKFSTMAPRHDCLLPAQAGGEIGRLGTYRVLKMLGAGGMGLVFAAEDTVLHRTVALKVMQRGLASDAGCRERFLREARAAAAIEHDNIVTVYQVGEDQGVPYLAMPLLRGETLHDRISRDPRLPVAEALRIGRETAAGLAAAHDKGLIHRDVKPANLWLEADTGRVKILDFGLARTAQGGVQVTRAGQILGTPSYMAPEQARGAEVDARSDLWSLGVVLYSLCTGRLPFPQKEMYALLAAVAVAEPPPVRDLNPHLPPALAELIARLLAKKPDDRPASARVVVEAIRAIERGEQIRPPTRRRRAPLVAAVCLAVLGVAGYFAGPAVYRIVTNQGELVIVTDDPDVKVIVSQGGQRVQILDLKTKREINLTAGQYEIELTDGPEKLRLSTDRFTLTRGGRKIVTVVRSPAPVGGGNPKIVPNPAVGEARAFKGHTDVVAAVAFSADGKRAVSGSWDKTVRLWNVADGKQLALFTGHDRTVRSVAISPKDADRLASGGGDGTVRLWNAATGKEQRAPLRGHKETVTCVLFSPDGKRLLSASLDRTVQEWSAANGRGLSSLPARPGDSMGPVESAALSPDGRLLLCGCQEPFVYLWNLETQEHVRRFAGHVGVVNSVAFAADGKRAASGGSDRTIRVWKVENGEELHRLTLPDGVQSVAFLPDGGRVLAGCRDGTVRLWDVAGERELRCFKGHEGRVWSVAVSPDGRHALSGADDAVVRLWPLPPADGPGTKN